jgi:hypothetical protein
VNRNTLLPWLLALLMGVIGLIWFDPSAPSEMHAAAPAVERAVAPGQGVNSPALALKEPVDVRSEVPDSLEMSGNPFASRAPESPIQLPIASRAPTAVRVSPALPAKPLVAPPPWEVIGTWDDGKAPGVFVSGPTGTVLARTGTLLMNEYKVTEVAPRQLTVQHIASKQDFKLLVPR